METLPLPETLVEIDLLEVAGGTEIHLVHSGFTDRDFADGHEDGWQQCFVRLDGILRAAP